VLDPRQEILAVNPAGLRGLGYSLEVRALKFSDLSAEGVEEEKIGSQHPRAGGNAPALQGRLAAQRREPVPRRPRQPLGARGGGTVT
jgi:hypothetical protein